MNVLLLNGSPHPKGCTYTALKEVANTLEQQGIETEWMHLGVKPIAGCIDCGSCRKTGKCFVDDQVNILLRKMPEIHGIVIGSPVYYAGPSGQLTAFLDRLFHAGGRALRGKPGAAVVSCRRGGASAAFDRLNKYFTINSMPVVSSQYWNQVHGYTPEEVRQDLEGLQTMRTLANNMAWLLKCIELGKQHGIELPVEEKRVATNFIR